MLKVLLLIEKCLKCKLQIASARWVSCLFLKHVHL